MAGLFVISLDFELHWGVFDKRDREGRVACYASMNEVVPAILDLFERFGINATWATVGSLMLENEDEWRSVLPNRLPQYTNKKYSSYSYALESGMGIDIASAHFAPQLVNQILAYPGQELATHTFSHYYCLEEGQSTEDFAADLKLAQDIALQKTGRQLTSLVFPRNQYNDAYLDICAANGINAVRTNPSNWFWTAIGNEDTSLMRRIFRTGDVFLPMGARSTYPITAIERHQNLLPVCIPASRLLRQYDPALSAMNKFRLRRIKNEMTYAAAHGECFHLWWHPENFGFYPKESLDELEQILQHFHNLHQRHDFKSKTMAEVAAKLGVD